MNTTTETTASAFFYVDGIPAKGTWVDLDASTTWEDIAAAIREKIPAADCDEILCADAEGEASHFLTALDAFDLRAWQDYAAALEESHLDPEVAAAYCDNLGEWTPQAVENAADCYAGTFDSRADFAEDLAEAMGTLDSIPENLRYYFDFEKFAHDLIVGGDYFESGGHYFANR